MGFLDTTEYHLLKRGRWGGDLSFFRQEGFGYIVSFAPGMFGHYYQISKKFCLKKQFFGLYPRHTLSVIKKIEFYICVRPVLLENCLVIEYNNEGAVVQILHI